MWSHSCSVRNEVGYGSKGSFTLMKYERRNGSRSQYDRVSVCEGPLERAKQPWPVLLSGWASSRAAGWIPSQGMCLGCWVAGGILSQFLSSSL